MLPVPLLERHKVSAFSSASEVLNIWLQQKAVANEASGASRTFVIHDINEVVMGYYSLCNAAIDRQSWAKRTHGIPHPVPVTLLARLAVDLHYKGQGLGKILLEDSIEKALEASKTVGSMAIITHPIDGLAQAFYQYFGFRPLYGQSNTMFLPLNKL